MNQEPPPDLPSEQLPDVDLGRIEQALASSRSLGRSEQQGFRLVREVGRSSSPRLVEPLTLAVTADDRIVVLDQVGPQEFLVLRFTADGACEAVGSPIPRSEQEGLLHPTGLSLNAQGELFITDGDLNAIVQFSSDGRWLATHRSAGESGGRFHNPRDLDVSPDGSLFVADSFNDRVVRFSLTDSTIQSWSEFDNPLTGESDDSLYEPASVCAASDGLLYIADSNNHRVLAFHGPRLVAQWSGGGLFESPTEVRLTADQQSLLIADNGNLRVRRFQRETGLQNVAGCCGSLSLSLGDDAIDIRGGGDIDVLRSGAIALINPRRQSVAIVDFLE